MLVAVPFSSASIVEQAGEEEAVVLVVGHLLPGQTRHNRRSLRDRWAYFPKRPRTGFQKR